MSVRKGLGSLGLVVAMAVGVTVGSASASSAAPSTLAAAPVVQAQSIVLSLGGEQIVIPLAELAAESRPAVAAQSVAAQAVAAQRVARPLVERAVTLSVSRAVGQIQLSAIRVMFVNPITVIKCIAELASFVFGSAGKLAYISAKIVKVVNKSAKLKALLKKVGGVKAALKGLWDKLKHKKMSAKHRADVDGFWKGLAKQAGSVVGVGNCLHLF